jgi:hypothetical protein
MRVIKAKMMLLQGGGIGSAAGAAKDDRCTDKEARKKQKYDDGLQEAKPPNEKT